MVDRDGSTLYEVDPASGNVSNSTTIANQADDLATIGSQVFVMSRDSIQLDVLTRTGTFVGNVVLDLSAPPVAIGGGESASGEGFHTVTLGIGDILEGVDFGNRIALLGPNLVRWDNGGLFGNQGDGTSWGDAGNWTVNGYADVLPGSRGDNVVFEHTPGPVSIQLGADQVTASLSFEGDYEISGNSLSITSGKISVDQDATAMIHADVNPTTDLVKDGSGTLKLNGAAGNVVVAAGLLGGTGVLANLAIQGGGLSPDSSLTVDGTTTIMERVNMQLGADTERTVNSARLAIAENTELRVEARSQIGAAGDYMLTLFTANEIVGRFSVEPAVGEHLGSGIFASEIGKTGSALEYTKDRVTISVFQAQAGDANGDRVVDVSDFNVWNEHRFQNAQTWLDGDFNGDHVVDGSDFNLWFSNRFQQLPVDSRASNADATRLPQTPTAPATANIDTDAVLARWPETIDPNSTDDTSFAAGSNRLHEFTWPQNRQRKMRPLERTAPPPRCFWTTCFRVGTCRSRSFEQCFARTFVHGDT